jgi:hypothetical protein
MVIGAIGAHFIFTVTNKAFLTKKEDIPKQLLESPVVIFQIKLPNKQIIGYR